MSLVPVSEASEALDVLWDVSKVPNTNLAPWAVISNAGRSFHHGISRFAQLGPHAKKVIPVLPLIILSLEAQSIMWDVLASPLPYLLWFLGWWCTKLLVHYLLFYKSLDDPPLIHFLPIQGLSVGVGESPHLI